MLDVMRDFVRFNPEVLRALVETQGAYPVFTDFDDAYWGIVWPQEVNPAYDFWERSPERVADFLLTTLNGSWAGYIWNRLYKELFSYGSLPPEGLIPRGFTIPTINVRDDPSEYGIRPSFMTGSRRATIRHLYPFDIYRGRYAHPDPSFRDTAYILSASQLEQIGWLLYCWKERKWATRPRVTAPWALLEYDHIVRQLELWSTERGQDPVRSLEEFPGPVLRVMAATTEPLDTASYHYWHPPPSNNNARVIHTNLQLPPADVSIPEWLGVNEQLPSSLLPRESSVGPNRGRGRPRIRSQRQRDGHATRAQPQYVRTEPDGPTASDMGGRTSSGRRGDRVRFQESGPCTHERTPRSPQRGPPPSVSRRPDDPSGPLEGERVASTGSELPSREDPERVMVSTGNLFDLPQYALTAARVYGQGDPASADEPTDVPGSTVLELGTLGAENGTTQVQPARSATVVRGGGFAGYQGIRIRRPDQSTVRPPLPRFGVQQPRMTAPLPSFC